jgi:hypothetical protein
VSRTFGKLQAATITDAADQAAVAAATASKPTSLVNLAPAAFPLFTTTRQWLMLLVRFCGSTCCCHIFHRSTQVAHMYTRQPHRMLSAS